MVRLIVTVNKLNKRKYIPARIGDKEGIVGEVLKGFTFEGEEVLNVPLPTPEKWYKDRDGYYYWGGGVSIIGTAGPALFNENISFDLSNANWSMKDYEIDKIWKYTKGENVKVAIIDTGLNYNHTNIKKKTNIEYYNIFNHSNSPADCSDNEGHGTHCAGVVCAHGPDIYGVAPASDLLIIKATVNGSLDCRNLALAINQAVILGADIISVSYEFYDSEPDYGILNDAVLNASIKNVLVVACSGNAGNSLILADTYPASFLTAVGVGSSDENKHIWKKTTLNTNIDILAPGSNIKLLSLDNNSSIIDSGTSYATPYIAGVCALLLSASKKKNLDLIRNILKIKANRKGEIQAEIQELYKDPNLKIPNLGIVNPLETFNAINV